MFSTKIVLVVCLSVLVGSTNFVNGETCQVNELVYHLDLVKCPSAHFPDTNSAVTYRTWIYFNYFIGTYTCLPICVRRKQYSKTCSLFILKSHEYPSNYEAKTLQYFNIQCPSGYEGQIMHEATQLEPRKTIGNVGVCVDYIHLYYPNTNSSCYVCGNEKPTEECMFSEFEGNLHVTFRSGPSNNYAGFNYSISCYVAAEQNLPGCIKLSKSIYWRSYMSTQTLYGGDRQNFIQLAATLNSVPKDSTEILFEFYDSYLDKTLTSDVDSHKHILALAIVTEKCCDAAIKSVGREILKLFSHNLVLHTRQQFWKAKKEQLQHRNEELFYDSY